MVTPAELMGGTGQINTTTNRVQIPVKTTTSPINKVKSGLKTTEFYITLLINLGAGVGIVIPATSPLGKEVAALAAAATVASYCFSRAQVKAAALYQQ